MKWEVTVNKSEVSSNWMDADFMKKHLEYKKIPSSPRCWFAERFDGEFYYYLFTDDYSIFNDPEYLEKLREEGWKTI